MGYMDITVQYMVAPIGEQLQGYHYTGVTLEV